MRYEVFHTDFDGHCGPFDAIGDAIVYAVRNIVGCTSSRDLTETVTDSNGIAITFVIRRKHKCNCDHCPINGETFYHVRSVRNV